LDCWLRSTRLKRKRDGSARLHNSGADHQWARKFEATAAAPVSPFSGNT
jgi:hypothetical protein